MATPDAVTILNTLIRVAKDGQEGFEQAAELAMNDNLKRDLMEYARQRAGFAMELQALVNLHGGGEPAERADAASALHRAWISLRSRFTTDQKANDQLILDESERGEDVAVDAYQKASREMLPDNVMSVVRAQYDIVRSTHDQVKRMRDAFKQGA